MESAAPKDVPPHDAPDAAFMFTDPDERDAALIWARGVMDNIPWRSDADLARACRVILVNRCEYVERAALLLPLLKPEVQTNAA